jgi:hypothetical protein
MEEKNLNEIKSELLSDEDINVILGGTNIFKYPDLEYKSSIDEIFDNQGRAIMLFLTEDENTGHWICMHKEDNKIHYFDPYGLEPEEEKKFIPHYLLEKLNQTRPYLYNLLYNSPYEIYSNEYPFQKDKSNVTTCGRHCAVRLLYKNLDLDEYLDMIKISGYSPDDFVSKLTFKIIQK